MEIWILLILGLSTAALVALWWFNHPKLAILGQSDLSSSIHLMLRSAEDGGRIRLYALDRDAAVTLTRLAEEARNAQLEVALISEKVNPSRVADIGNQLKCLGMSLISQEALGDDGGGRSALRIVTNFPADARIFGSIADLALRVAGLMEGDRYRYRFEGRVDVDRLRQNAVERTHAAGASAPREWQAKVFRRMSRYLRTASSSARSAAKDRKNRTLR